VIRVPFRQEHRTTIRRLLAERLRLNCPQAANAAWSCV